MQLNSKPTTSEFNLCLNTNPMKVTGWKIQVNRTKGSHLKLVGPDLESVDLKRYKSSQFSIKTVRVTSSKTLFWHCINQMDWNWGVLHEISLKCLVLFLQKNICTFYRLFLMQGYKAAANLSSGFIKIPNSCLVFRREYKCNTEQVFLFAT